jgi:hypothetical protein
MRWRTCCALALFMVTLTGCPEDFGKEGTMDRAAHQDVLDSIPDRCTPDERERLCAPGKPEAACRERCG